MHQMARLGKVVAVLVLTAAMSFCFIFGHDYVTQCDYFKAEDLKVEGNQKLSASQVRHQANLRPGVNILAVNLTLTRKRLLAHPLIARASVGRELPSTIVIHVEEHVPLAVLDMGRLFVVNMEGEIFKELDSTDPKNLPVVSGLTFSDITVADAPRSGPFKAVMTVLGMGRNNHGILPNDKIKKIDVDREIGLTLFTTNRFTAVKIGYDDYGKKFQKLKTIQLYLETQRRFLHLDSIDLNNLNRIVVTPAGADSPDGIHPDGIHKEV